MLISSTSVQGAAERVLKDRYAKNCDSRSFVFQHGATILLKNRQLISYLESEKRFFAILRFMFIQTLFSYHPMRTACFPFICRKSWHFRN